MKSRLTPARKAWPSPAAASPDPSPPLSEHCNAFIRLSPDPGRSGKTPVATRFGSGTGSGLVVWQIPIGYEVGMEANNGGMTEEEGGAQASVGGGWGKLGGEQVVVRQRSRKAGPFRHEGPGLGQPVAVAIGRRVGSRAEGGGGGGEIGGGGEGGGPNDVALLELEARDGIRIGLRQEAEESNGGRRRRVGAKERRYCHRCGRLLSHRPHLYPPLSLSSRSLIPLHPLRAKTLTPYPSQAAAAAAATGERESRCPSPLVKAVEALAELHQWLCRCHCSNPITREPPHLCPRQRRMVWWAQAYTVKGQLGSRALHAPSWGTSRRGKEGGEGRSHEDGDPKEEADHGGGTPKKSSTPTRLY